MKKINVSFFAILFFCAPLFFVSCDKIEELTTVNVELGDVDFDIPLNFDEAEISPAQMKRTDAGDFVTFSGRSVPINLDSPMFNQLKNYQCSSIVFTISEVKVKISTTTESGTVIKDFTSTTTSGTEKILDYTKEGNINLGVSYSDANLTQYMKDIFLAVQDNKTVVVDASGLTDIVPSEITETDIVVASITLKLKAEIKLLK